MVAVDHHGFGGDIRYRVDERFVLAIAGHALEAHPHLDHLGESLARLDAEEVRLVLAEGVQGLERDRHLVADVLALELLLDLREDPAEAAVEVFELRALVLEGLAVAVLQLVVERDHRAAVNWHARNRGTCTLSVPPRRGRGDSRPGGYGARRPSCR